MKNRIVKTISRTIKASFRGLALVVCVATVGLGLSATANEGKTTFITFDPPGSTFTFPLSINRAITGIYFDASGLEHGFLLVPHGN